MVSVVDSIDCLVDVSSYAVDLFRHKLNRPRLPQERLEDLIKDRSPSDRGGRFLEA